MIIEEEKTQEPAQVVYTQPTLFRRVMANLLDLLIFVFLTVALLFAARAIVNNTPAHIAQLNKVNQTRLDSCLYVENKSGTQITIIQYLDDSGEIATEFKRMDLARQHIEGNDAEIVGFLNFCKDPNYGNMDIYTTVSNKYDEFRLQEKYKLLDEPYFIKDTDNKVVVNPNCTADNKSYYQVYKSFINDYCMGVLASAFPSYRDSLRSLSIDLFAIEIPVSYAIAGIIVYLVPTLIFRRGHKTIGKLAYKIGVVGKDCLNISAGKAIARFAIFFFAILLLSLVTFAIPMIISFTMMAFSKKKQSFQDYMLGLYEVDTSNTKIYYDLEEAAIDQLPTNKKAVEFKRVEVE